MKTTVIERTGRSGSWLALAAALAVFAPAQAAFAQEASSAASPPAPIAAPDATGRLVYLPADFARFAPKTALDMLNNVPGFTITGGDEVRGLGQATTNVLIDGQRLSLKSESISDRLQKISANKVARIEIVEGSSLGIPGLSGQVANIVTGGGGLSGQFNWKSRFRPGYVDPEWFGGDASISGTAGRLDYTLSLGNDFGRGSVKGPIAITDGAGAPLEYRDTHLANILEQPKIAGSFKWDGPGSSVANFTASYSRKYYDSTLTEERTRPDGNDAHLDYDPHERTYDYEIGGDVEFALGPGRLKLIGLERYTHTRYREDYVLTPADGAPAAGSRYTNVSESGEHIGRAEYGWAMLGGDWQLAAEAAFNRYNGEAHLFDLAPDGTFVDIPFPFGTGGVTEDRYEAILTHSRQLASNLSLQIGAGAEYSQLTQSGTRGLTRTFERPKGSASVAWTPRKGLDLSLKFARVVGQLSFDDFLAAVDLEQGNGSAGNVELVPPQSWELEFEAKKDLGRWGSTNLKLYAKWYEDYIDWIVLPGELAGELIEARGNIATASLYGIDWTSTVNFDPLGWKGAKLDLRVNIDDPSIRDPITGETRGFSDWTDVYIEGGLRHDIPGSAWAWGGGFEAYHALPYYRLMEVGRGYEGPIYTSAFIENKDVFGLTVRAEVFNATNGHNFLHRTIYDGYRGDAPVLFNEDGKRPVGAIYTLAVKGTF